MGSIIVVRGGDIPSASAGVSTEKWTRRVIDVNDLITINKARNGPRAISAWHHHGDNTGYVYVLHGQLRIEWGPGGRNVAEVGAGDFYVISPNTIHREANPGSGEQALIAFAVGRHPKFVNVDAPEPDGAAAGSAGAVHVVRRDDIPSGPSSHGMVRRMIDVADTIALAEARNAPETTSSWHHHGQRTTCVYVVQGQAHLDWGPGGREQAELSAGDFYVILPDTIHREGNPGARDQLIAGFYLGPGPKIVNVSGPEAA